MGSALHARRAAGALATALRAGRAARLQVAGRCMRPLLREGDWVRIERDAPPAAGQVVLARSAGGWVCHRVVAAAARVELVGDRSLAAVRLTPARVLGRVVEVERRGRRLRLDGPPGPAERGLAFLHRLALRLRLTPLALPLEATRRRLRGWRSRRLWRTAPAPVASPTRGHCRRAP